MAEGEREDSTGAGPREFPLTSWGLIAGVHASKTITRHQALESLCQRYWKPVYHFVRRAWSKSREDAKDLTQAFFLRILDGDALQRFQPERGGFRHYLKMLLRGFAADQQDALKALKRGGGVRTVALEGRTPLEDLVPDARAQQPEEFFDWAWKKEILENAIERTREWFASVNRTRQFRAFEEYDLVNPDQRPTYAEVAARLGASESDVRNHLFAVRERLRTEIRAELSQTVSDPKQLEEEWNALFES